VTAGQLPEGRYGSRTLTRRRRWAAPVAALLVVLAGLVVAVIGYRNLGSTPVLSLSVIRDDPSQPAACIVRARSRDGEETGRKEVYVPPAAGPIVLTTIVRTSRPPVTADVYGCSLAVPPYLVPAPGH
jgi:hypothetical protein